VDDATSVNEVVDIGMTLGAEEFFVEPVNGRGPGLRQTAQRLRDASLMREAGAVEAVRTTSGWSTYTRNVLVAVQTALRAHGALDRLRFLLYASRPLIQLMAVFYCICI
jgi:hypothetical protein